METKHRELADLEDLLRLPGVQYVLQQADIEKRFLTGRLHYNLNYLI